MLSLPTHKRILALTGSALLVILVGWADYATGPQVAWSFFYLLPVGLAAWVECVWAGIFMAVVSIVVREGVETLWQVSYATPFIRYWNGGERLALFVLAAVVVSAVRRSHQALERKATSLSQEVAERKRAEEALKVTLKDLDHRSTQLYGLALELTQAEQRERQRVAQLLHDHLQQTLAAAKLKLILAGKETTAEKRQSAIEGVHDLLDQSVRTARSLAVELSPPELHNRGLVAALRQLGQQMQEAHDLAVEVAADLEIPPDNEGVCILLYQGVREVLFNIVKHAGVKSARVCVTRSGAGPAEIVVEDQGAGFDSATLGRHLGFGLANARGRIELIGGKLDIQSVPGRGTRVTLVAPLRATARRAGTAESSARELGGPRAAEAAHKIRTLIADDYENLRLLLVTQLQHEADIEIVGQAANGEEAVRLAQGTHPDVILMDVSMPVMDGVEATRRILAEMPDIRVIGLSAYGDATQNDAIRAAGASTCLVKESSLENLADIVRASCANRAYRS
ncbi:MAG: response regulator [Candidatus Brocadiia bacterium]|jgi:signal transduction histidine kinase/CheY-like chemotaxis protein